MTGERDHLHNCAKASGLGRASLIFTSSVGKKKTDLKNQVLHIKSSMINCSGSERYFLSRCGDEIRIMYYF